MVKKFLFCLLVFSLWSCSSNNDEPQVPVSPISLDTPPSEYMGYVYTFNDLDYNYFLSVGFDKRCQLASIPQAALDNMTTESLSQCSLFWPLCGNHIFYPNGRNSIYDGILISFNHCNVLKELAKREHGAIALLKLYKFLKYKEFEYKHNWYETDISKLNDEISHKQHLELLFATEYFTPKLSKDMLILLADRGMELILKNIDEKGEIAWWRARYTFVMLQRVLLCYDKFTPILSDDEKTIFTQNIESFGIEKDIGGFDQNLEYSSLISQKVALILASNQN